MGETGESKTERNLSKLEAVSLDIHQYGLYDYKCRKETKRQKQGVVIWATQPLTNW